MRIKLILAMLALGATGTLVASEGGYQRYRHVPGPKWGDARGGPAPPHHWHSGYHAPQTVVANHFQRPYPYHLDYYRMRYGGSYAPYFGNMYGVPQVVAPFYGYPPVPYGAHYGGYDYGTTPPFVPPVAAPPDQGP